MDEPSVFVVVSECTASIRCVPGSTMPCTRRSSTSGNRSTAKPSSTAVSSPGSDRPRPDVARLPTAARGLGAMLSRSGASVHPRGPRAPRPSTRERLDALGPAPRAELLQVLMLPDFDRAPLAADSCERVPGVERDARGRRPLGVVSVNAAAAIRPPRAPRATLNVPDTRACEATLDRVRGRDAEGPVTLALGTGMRLGEILALRWKDVDLERKAPPSSPSTRATCSSKRRCPPAFASSSAIETRSSPAPSTPSSSPRVPASSLPPSVRRKPTRSPSAG